jgi:hypothetical protein
MRFGIVGAIIVVLSISVGTTERADAGHRDPGRGGCGQLVTLKHPDLKGPERSAEIKKCSANGDAYSKQAGF